ncbi:uncharacterized protein LY79DRAFT_167284 [Colletotrichum navitas]|uniref:Uncharacterized protein n=1 Tax=Colletotrichum navitas TaxID=681940 RepID=A0AAD8Q299_9PEZI|nr:uncharacterized protein LY79DRAFT_167284 [Colletotrichum navitas]KAK1594026.1 hypothetical protein LY79DRAFT_167284 [Colletotrichum navitas]
MHALPRLTMDEMVIDYWGKIAVRDNHPNWLIDGRSELSPSCTPSPRPRPRRIIITMRACLACIHQVGCLFRPFGFRLVFLPWQWSVRGNETIDMDPSRSTRCTLPGLSTVILGFSRADDCILCTPCVAQPLWSLARLVTTITPRDVFMGKTIHTTPPKPVLASVKALQGSPTESMLGHLCQRLYLR